MPATHVFGYGSLVNTKTHDFANVAPAEISGWRRAWLCTPERDVAYLSVFPEIQSRILGVVAQVPPEAWPALDEREAAYDKHTATPDVKTAANPDDVAIYAVPARLSEEPTANTPILQSYLDVVLMGYHTHFGDEGVAHFLDTTDGWHTPIVRDRDAPRYPRAQTIDANQAANFDAALIRIGASFI